MKLPPPSEWEEQHARRHLVDFVPYATPRYLRPSHLAPLLDRFERAFRGERQKVVCHAPPRHAKTESVLHVPAWTLRQDPTFTISYSTYGDRLSRSKSRKARAIAERTGVALESTALNEWRTAEGGGVLAGGVGGPLTGHGVRMAIIDDPVKNRAEAESSVHREKLTDWYEDVLKTRVEPGGSTFCFMTRWHPEDLAGYLIKNHGFEYLCFPAIDGDGRALWSEGGWTVEELEQKRGNAYTWASLFQGQPRPRGDAVFDGCSTYEKLPNNYRAAYGVDLAYTKKTKSDFSVAVRMLRQDRRGEKPLFYVASVLRKQERAPYFRKRLVTLHEQEPGAPWRWYAYGAEVGVADLFDTEDDGVPIEAISAPGDKLIRSGPVAEAWNDHRVLVPRNAPWLGDFLDIVNGFTGVNDAHDDDVDAMAAAYDLLTGGDESDIDEDPGEPQRMGLGAQSL